MAQPNCIGVQYSWTNFKHHSLHCRRSITATLSALPTGAVGAGEDLSIGSAGSLAARHAYQPTEWNSAHSGMSLLPPLPTGSAGQQLSSGRRGRWRLFYAFWHEFNYNFFISRKLNNNIGRGRRNRRIGVRVTRAIPDRVGPFPVRAEVQGRTDWPWRSHATHRERHEVLGPSPRTV